MKNRLYHGTWTIVVGVSIGISSGWVSPRTLDEPDSVDDLIAELESLEIPVEYGRVEHPREAKHADQIERVRFGHYAQASELPERAIVILAALPNLRELGFIRVSFPTAWLLKLKDSQRVEHLSFLNMPDAFSDPEDLHFLTVFPRLQSLRLRGCNLGDDYLQRLLVLRNLTTLGLSSNQITEEGLATLMRIESLQHLELAANRIGGSMLDVQRCAAKLNYLSIGNNPVYSQAVTLEELEQLLALPEHTRRINYMTDASLAEIAGILPGPVTGVFSPWRAIRLTGYDAEGQRFTLNLQGFLDDDKLRDIGTFQQLRNLEIRRSDWGSQPLDITDQGLAHLSGLAHLETLRVFTGHTLTGRSLAPLATMPALRIVECGSFDLDGDGLRWLGSTPQLSELILSTGRVEGAALVDINRAESLRTMHLTDVTMTLPPGRTEIGNVTQMTVEARSPNIEQFAVIGRFRSLTALTIGGLVTDAHVAQLTTLDQLQQVRFTNMRSVSYARPSVTTAGLLHLRHIKTLTYIQAPGRLDFQAMADQFGWQFWGCCSGCCDWTPAAVRLTAGDLHARLPKGRERGEIRGATLVLRGPLKRDRLVLREQDLPPAPARLYITDCAIGELHFEGWMPPEISIWGRSHVGRITSSAVAESARSNWSYRYLQQVRKLVVPPSPHLSSLLVADCTELESLRLEGFYPHLNQLQVSNLNRLKYLAAPYTGDAPQVNFENGFRQITELPSLRLLKMPGTALTDASFGEPSSSWPPPALYELDVRATEVSGDWLTRLADIPTLRIVRIGQCRKIREESKAMFRQSRPEIQLDDQTLHRPSPPGSVKTDGYGRAAASPRH